MNNSGRNIVDKIFRNLLRCSNEIVANLKPPNNENYSFVSLASLTSICFSATLKNGKYIAPDRSNSTADQTAALQSQPVAISGPMIGGIVHGTIAEGAAIHPMLIKIELPRLAERR